MNSCSESNPKRIKALANSQTHRYSYKIRAPLWQVIETKGGSPEILVSNFLSACKLLRKQNSGDLATQWPTLMGEFRTVSLNHKQLPFRVEFLAHRRFHFEPECRLPKESVGLDP